MRITEIITEAEDLKNPSRRGFLGALGKGAAAATIAGSGLGGLMGGAKDAKAAQDPLGRTLYYEMIQKIGYDIGVIKAGQKFVGYKPSPTNWLQIVAAYLKKHKVDMASDKDVLRGFSEGFDYFSRMTAGGTRGNPRTWEPLINSRIQDLNSILTTIH
jgi:hypothetical protein